MLRYAQPEYFKDVESDLLFGYTPEGGYEAPHSGRKPEA